MAGAGPWEFTPDSDLAPGESFTLDCRNLKFRKTKGYFKKYMPLDEAQITNLSDSAAVGVEYNGVFNNFVVPNAIETFDKAGITRITVTNRESAGGATIAADEVVIEVVKNPYDADQAARDRQRRGPLGDVIEKFTGLSLGGL